VGAGVFVWKWVHQPSTASRQAPHALIASSPASRSSPVYVYHGHIAPVLAVAWSPDSARIASGSGDATVQVWDPLTGHLFVTYSEHSNQVEGVSWSSDGKLMASASLDTTVQVWQAASGKKVFVHTSVDPSSAHCVAWSPRGAKIISGDERGEEEWDTSGSPIIYPEVVFPGGGDGRVNAVAWSPDAKRAATGSISILKVWNTTSGEIYFASPNKVVTGFHAVRDVLSVAWSPNGQFLAAGGQDEQVQVLKADTGDGLFTYSQHSGPVTGVAWSPDSTSIASASGDRTVQVWEALTGKQQVIYQGHSDIVRAVAWAPDGKYIASASDDRTVQVWKPL
jgi:WD40 repeat protein